MTKIFISAGDSSGEIHAAKLVSEIKKIEPGAFVSALGGDNLRNSADRFLFNLIDLSAFGFWAPFKQYFRLRKLFNRIKTLWSADRPDKVILVDYYGFNIHLAKEARGRNIPVYYYISPQVWASRAGRIEKLRKYINKMIVILPFEEKLYKDRGVDAVFAGHPLIDLVPAAQWRYGEKPVIGIFPGSRPSVAVKHLDTLYKAAALINKSIPSEFLVFGTDNLKDLYAGCPYKVVFEKDFKQRQNLTLALSVSGTVSLENTLLGIPMVVMYKLSALNYRLAKMLVKIKYITMANILTGKMLVPELIQSDASPEKIANKAIEMLKDRELLRSVSAELASLRSILGNSGSARRASGIIMEKA